MREEDVNAYLAAVRDALAHNTSASKEVLNRLASLLLMYRVKSAGLESVVWEIVEVDRRTVLRAENAPQAVVDTLAPTFLFALQSGYFSLFLGQMLSGTIGEIPHASQGSLSKESYLLFSQLSAHGTTEASILPGFKLFFGVK